MPWRPTNKRDSDAAVRQAHLGLTASCRAGVTPTGEEPSRTTGGLVTLARDEHIQAKEPGATRHPTRSSWRPTRRAGSGSASSSNGTLGASTVFSSGARDAALAEDVYQEAFLRLHRAGTRTTHNDRFVRGSSASSTPVDGRTATTWAISGDVGGLRACLRSRLARGAGGCAPIGERARPSSHEPAVRRSDRAHSRASRRSLVRRHRRHPRSFRGCHQATRLSRAHTSGRV